MTGKATVATVAAREPLRPVPPTPYPLLLTETRVASRQALVAYRGNRYSVPPELAGATVTVSRPVGAAFSTSPPPQGSWSPGTGSPPTAPGSWSVTTAMSPPSTPPPRWPPRPRRGPHRRKERIPPGPAARAAADMLRGAEQPTLSPVIDLAAYEHAAKEGTP